MYIGDELQLPNKDRMKCMVIVCQIYLHTDFNPEGTGNYRVWEDHTEYTIEMFHEPTSKLTAKTIA